MEVVGQARILLAESGDTRRADDNKRYFKSPFEFVGVTKKDINRIGAKLNLQLKGASRDSLLKTLEALWGSGVHEEMSLAIVLAALLVQKFDGGDVAGTFSRWIDECRTWDHIDELCICVTGALVLDDSSVWNVIESWSTSDHMLKRRASLISHLPSVRAQRPEVDLLERTCRRLASEGEFFIRKAIGWVLRELADHDVESMIAIFRRLCPSLSKLSRREATRKLDAARRDALLLCCSRHAREDM